MARSGDRATTGVGTLLWLGLPTKRPARPPLWLGLPTKPLARPKVSPDRITRATRSKLSPQGAEPVQTYRFHADSAVYFVTFTVVQ
jgi:hypothetical protein